jgi:hypothetical protein
MISNISEIRSVHERFVKRNMRALLDAADFAAEHTKQHIRTSHKFKSRTGALIAGVTTKVIKLRSGVVMRQTNKAKHAKFVEFGTRPHVIRASRKKALRFSVGGRVRFARTVNHPGSRAFRFGYRAHNASHRVMGQFLRGEMSRLSKSF